MKGYIYGFIVLFGLTAACWKAEAAYIKCSGACGAGHMDEGCELVVNGVKLGISEMPVLPKIQGIKMHGTDETSSMHHMR